MSLLDEITGLNARERALAKIAHFKANVTPGAFQSGQFSIECVGLSDHGGILTLFVTADRAGEPVALGMNEVRTERILIPSPRILVPDTGDSFRLDPLAAIRDVISQTIKIIARSGRPKRLDSVGRTTLVVYPDSGTGATTVDGYCSRSSVNEIFSTIRGGAGTSAATTDPNGQIGLFASTTSNQYAQLFRWLATLDTSAIGANGTISSATFSIYGGSKANTLGSPDFHIGESGPASNNNVVAAEFNLANWGTDSFGSVSYASFSAAGYNDITMNQSGIDAISKTGITKYGVRLSWDILNDTTGLTWSSGHNSRFIFKDANTSGTTQDPKLTIEYSVPTSSGSPGTTLVHQSKALGLI